MVKVILKQLKCPGRVPISKGGKFCGVGLWDKSPAKEEGGRWWLKTFHLYNTFSLERQRP